MDTLALLCNLHADGPATLQRLRRVGCESLAALRRMDPVRLAERLEWNEKVAERFLREAALLSGRVEPERFEDEPPTDPGFELESELVEELDGQSDEFEDEEAEGASEDEAEVEDEVEAETGARAELAAETPAERMQDVLGAWRELDRVAPPAQPPSYEIPRPEPAPDLALAEARLDIPRALLARLGELEFQTLRQVAEADVLELSRALPLGYTRVQHVVYLAGRALRGLAPGEGRSPRAPASFTPPPNEPFETAGPFA